MYSFKKKKKKSIAPSCLVRLRRRKMSGQRYLIVIIYEFQLVIKIVPFDELDILSNIILIKMK